MTAKPDIPPEAVTNAEAAIYQVLDRWGYDLADYGSYRNRRIASEAAVEALTASAGLVAAAERERIAAVITGMRDELADHARQAASLPMTSRTLAARAGTLGDLLGLIGGES